MTIPRKGLRRIEVNGKNYEWTIRKKPTYSQATFPTEMTLIVELSDVHPQNTLKVNLGISRPDNWILTHQTSVTPKVVSKIIVAALQKGWEPHSAGTFVFDLKLSTDCIEAN